MSSFPQQWREVLNIAGGLASLAGFVFSGLAWRRATGAENAARQARDAVRRSNAGEDLQALSEKAEDLLCCTQNDQFEAVLLRSRDLLIGIPQARHRWQAFLTDDSLKQIEKAIKEIGRVSGALSAGRAAITPEVREKLLKSCHEVAKVLAEELGKTRRRAEGAN